MRLRLSVQRNNLPVSNVLWNVPDTNSPQAYTIVRLLEDVNKVLPLEADQWGLEDYIVEVGGFECLHFSPVSQTLKDDDLVSIRPLLTAEVRSRTLCGRHQISEDGRHLIDGISFGRPYLRQPHRPAVRIPSRKRQRIEDHTEVGAQETALAGLLTANGEVPLQLNENTHDDKHQQTSRSKSSPKKVKFTEINEDEDDSEDDDEFSPGDEDDEGMSTESDSESDSDTSTASDSSGGSSSSESDSDTGSDSSTDDSEDESAETGRGLRATKQRNRRRSLSRKLQQLKQAGGIESSATLKDYRCYLEDMKLSADESKAANPMSTWSDTVADDAAELEARKRKMLAEFEEATPRSQTPTQADVAMDEAAEVAIATPDTPPEIMSSKPAPTSEQPTKRLRPDTAAIGRILARQTRNIDKKPPKAKIAVKEPTPEPEGVNEPDFWKSRVNLSAFECWEEDHELSAPPFPFQQHWDPASQVMRDQMKNKKSKGKRKRIVVSESEEEEEAEKIILNYDDSPDTVKQDSDPTAAIESQLMQDVQVATHSDLPELPDDIASLPALQATDIAVGTIVAFKVWVIDPKTITPEITGYRTAVVEKEGDSGNGAGQFRLKLAERDVPKKENNVDEDGNKVRNAHDDFHMGGDDEDEEDLSLWEGVFAELVEPKLVKAAE
ncbi:hypothetical protein P280DRAFT_500007 [Massarina eburnea CBS 473.64]|uniref:DUF7357 domain-containing protein n=1 Tax=Massarina eburnea CBS 473.64 TaxID=1395130 RepID=A0A6A6RW36_9PLEO|nr:hypothetical protein P280DRAFT_500007 [Massarina eburnea CBS 473.64]